jgi:para-aminobenzoyl-glutamate transporter family
MTETTAPQHTFLGRMLDTIERVGNKVPHPAIIFVILIVGVIILSQILYLVGASVTYEVVEPAPITAEVGYPPGSAVEVPQVPVEDVPAEDMEVQTETTAVQGLLTADGIRFMVTSPVANFNNFGVVGIILVAMLGVGLAEEAGLIGALIRLLVRTSPRRLITFIIVLIGILSSVATDAGYLVLIPLAAAAFHSMGRHPLAGLAAGFAGVGAAFGVNLLIAPIDGIMTEVANESIALVDPSRTIDVTANYFFAAVSTFFLAIIITVMTEKVIEPRLGTYAGDVVAEPTDVVAPEESRGLRYALYGFLATLAVFLLIIVPPGAPLRNQETGAIFGDSPFMTGILVIISVLFGVAGYAYGKGAGTITNSVQAINSVVKTYSGLAGLIFLLLIIAQFIAFFNYTNIATVLAVVLADALEAAGLGPIPLIIGFVLVTALLDIIIPGVIPKWAIFAPIFIPLFLRLDIAPQLVLAAYRVGDSPFNVITPLMAYFAVIVVFAQRYEKTAGVGTIVSLMIPYSIVILLAWTVFLVVWFVIGIPLGPGAPVHLT